MNLTSVYLDYVFNSCCFSEAGAASGSGLISDDPRFYVDYGLRAVSPCANTGRNLGWEASALDLGAIRA